MKKYRLVVLSLALVLVLPGLLGAQAKVFKIGVENSQYYPHYTTDNGNYQGFARDVLDAFAKSKGYVFEYKPVPVNRLFSYLINGSVDFKYPDNEFWQGDLKKNLNLVYSDPVVDYVDGVVVLAANKGKGKANLKNLGTMRGFTVWEYLDDIKAGTIKLNENDDMVALINQTLIGRVDGVYSNVAVMGYLMREKVKQPAAIVYDPDLPHTKGSYKLSSIKYPAVVKEFNEFLVVNKALVKKLKDQYQIEAGL